MTNILPFHIQQHRTLASGQSHPERAPCDCMPYIYVYIPYVCMPYMYAIYMYSIWMYNICIISKDVDVNKQVKIGK